MLGLQWALVLHHTEVVPAMHRCVAQTVARAIPNHEWPHPRHTMVRGVVGVQLERRSRAGRWTVVHLNIYAAVCIFFNKLIELIDVLSIIINIKIVVLGVVLVCFLSNEELVVRDAGLHGLSIDCRDFLDCQFQLAFALSALLNYRLLIWLVFHFDLLDQERCFFFLFILSTDGLRSEKDLLFCEVLELANFSFRVYRFGADQDSSMSGLILYLKLDLVISAHSLAERIFNLFGCSDMLL